MKLVFHIGMGKCGSSSIQSWLSDLAASPEGSSKLINPGVWFDFIDPKYATMDGQEALFRSSDVDLEKFFARFIDYLGQFSPDQTFVFSNESLFEKYNFLEHMQRAFEGKFETRYIMYTRNPKDWLKSAYLQWSVRHKTLHNKIPYPRHDAERLLALYARARHAKHILDGKLVVRSVDDVDDVVDDFADYLGQNRPAERYKEYASGKNEEYLFRGTLNDYFPEIMEPHRFDDFSYNVRIGDLPDHQRIATAIQQAHEVENFIYDMPQVWDDYENLLGRHIDMPALRHQLENSNKKPVWENSPSDRMIDFLFAHVVELHARIDRLEAELKPQADKNTRD